MPRVSIFERFIVIPARKDEGFYALKLSVPVEIKDKYTGIFEESVAVISRLKEVSRTLDPGTA